MFNIFYHISIYKRGDWILNSCPAAGKTTFVLIGPAPSPVSHSADQVGSLTK